MGAGWERGLRVGYETSKLRKTASNDIVRQDRGGTRLLKFTLQGKKEKGGKGNRTVELGHVESLAERRARGNATQCTLRGEQTKK